MLGRVLSIDLAIRKTRDLGICLLDVFARGPAKVKFLSPLDLGLTDPLDAEKFAEITRKYCRDYGIQIVMIDGPQGWKHPDSALPHSRVCERVLSTPGKTGTKGQVKPANWRNFAIFSTVLFHKLTKCGANLVLKPILTCPGRGLLAIEIFPSSAWPRLGMLPLPGHKKAVPDDMEKRLKMIKARFNLEIDGELSHDRLQALVSGVAGIAILRGDPNGYVSEGVPPLQREDHILEGYIVNPRIY